MKNYRVETHYYITVVREVEAENEDDARVIAWESITDSDILSQTDDNVTDVEEI